MTLSLSQLCSPTRLPYTLAFGFVTFTFAVLSTYLYQGHFGGGFGYRERAAHSWTSSEVDHEPPFSSSHPSEKESGKQIWGDPVQAARNRTLGFGEIFYISLPHRTDRQDAMTILAAYTDVQIKMEPGIDGNSIQDKAIPYFRGLPPSNPEISERQRQKLKEQKEKLKAEQEAEEKEAKEAKEKEAKEKEEKEKAAKTKEAKEKEGKAKNQPHKNQKRNRDDIPRAALGCWRAHANAWKRVIDSGVETALILEDDVDWDVNVKEIMARASAELRQNSLRLQAPSEHEKNTAPYGLDWDILTVGQCFLHPNPDRLDLRQTYHDPDAPLRSQTKPNHIGDFERVVGRTMEEDMQTRVIVPAYAPACTMAYAITRRGAQKLLYHIGYSSTLDWWQVDLAIAERLIDGKLRGYSVHPPMFNRWTVGGGKDSDIAYETAHLSALDGQGNDGGSSDTLRNSARRAFSEEFSGNYWDEVLELEGKVRNPGLQKDGQKNGTTG